MIKLIVADKSPPILKAVSVAVRDYNIAIFTATTAGDLLRILDEEVPDFVLLSTLLPEMEKLDWGVGPLRDYKDGKILLLENRHATGSQELPEMDRLPKPFTADQIISKLREYFGDAVEKRTDPKMTGATAEGSFHQGVMDSRDKANGPLVSDARGANRSGVFGGITNAASDRHEVDELFPEVVTARMEKRIEKLVHEYCRKNFKSVAKEILTEELHRLAKKKSQHLMDV